MKTFEYLLQSINNHYMSRDVENYRVYRKDGATHVTYEVNGVYVNFSDKDNEYDMFRATENLLERSKISLHYELEKRCRKMLLNGLIKRFEVSPSCFLVELNNGAVIEKDIVIEELQHLYKILEREEDNVI